MKRSSQKRKHIPPQRIGRESLLDSDPEDLEVRFFFFDMTHPFRYGLAYLSTYDNTPDIEILG